MRSLLLSAFLIAGLLVCGVAQGAKKANDPQRVADLHVVDCLLPSMVRRIGNTNYTTPRRPIRTTAADCRRRGGEYTNYDEANYKTALEIWLSAAEGGDPDAQATVGEIYERGQGGEPDYRAAASWYAKAAEQGNSRAQFNLGSLYAQGLGVVQDRVAALAWYRKAWGMSGPDMAQSTAQPRELEESLDRRDARIRSLENKLDRLQKEAKGSTANEANLKREIADLRLWIVALESERKQTVASSSMPKMREPRYTGSSSLTGPSAISVKSGDVDFGRYHALIIGNQHYANIESLDTPENDALKIADLLKNKYGYSVHLLLNADNISVMEAINDLNQRLEKNDNLLIYYAGHGTRVQTGNFESGYWLPVNADAPPRNTFWVSNEFVTGHLSSIRARRVMVVADSCYAGLLSDAPGYLLLEDGPVYTPEFLKYKLRKRARLLLTSGGDKPVLDNGAPGHSVFASVLLETLQNNEEILSGPQLFVAIDEKVRSRSRNSGYAQAAEYKVIKGAGHEVGDFFFVPL